MKQSSLHTSPVPDMEYMKIRKACASTGQQAIELGNPNNETLARVQLERIIEGWKCPCGAICWI